MQSSNNTFVSMGNTKKRKEPKLGKRARSKARKAKNKPNRRRRVDKRSHFGIND